MGGRHKPWPLKFPIIADLRRDTGCTGLWNVVQLSLPGVWRSPEVAGMDFTERSLRMHPDRTKGREEKSTALKQKHLPVSSPLKTKHQPARSLRAPRCGRHWRREAFKCALQPGLAHIHHWLNLSFLSYSLMPKCEKVSMPELNF